MILFYFFQTFKNAVQQSGGNTLSCSMGCFFHTGCSLALWLCWRQQTCGLEEFLAKQNNWTMGPGRKDEELGQCPSPCWRTRFSWGNREISWELALQTHYEEFLKKFLISHPPQWPWEPFCFVFSSINPSSHISVETVGVSEGFEAIERCFELLAKHFKT